MSSLRQYQVADALEVVILLVQNVEPLVMMLSIPQAVTIMTLATVKNVSIGGMYNKVRKQEPLAI